MPAFVGYRSGILEMCSRLEKVSPNYELIMAPGYRVYFVQHEQMLVVLLADGDKHSQARDIKMALELARNL